MAVLGRLLVGSAERLDLPDLLSIDSYTAGDFKYLLQTFVGPTSPYVITGFDIINPAITIGTSSISINIANSAMYYPGAGAGSFFYGLPSTQPLTPTLITNATNYVYLTLTTTTVAQDTRAFWDPDGNGGTGDEFTEEVNTESVIEVQVNVSTSSFPDNTVPVAIVNVGATVISSITDARPLMFRLGSGGVSPNPNNRFAWPALPNSSYERQEPPVTITSGSGADPFQGGDKNIMTWKGWMDAVMTKLAELGGTQFWYQDTSSYGIIDVFHDALATTFKSKGSYQHSTVTPGLLTWTEDVQILSVSDPRKYILRSGNITLPNENVAYLDLIRNQPINSSDAAVAWTTGQPYVNTPNGSIGFFANLSQGDWIKKVSDDPTLFLRVEQFYDSVNLGGSTTTAANAKSIRLSANYTGATTNDVAHYDQGVYLSTALLNQTKTNAAITTAGGNFMWFANRSDTIENIASISTVSLSGTIVQANGATAQCSVTGHGLVDGYQITVTAPVAQAGTYSVDVVDSNTFYFSTTNTTTGALTAFYGLLTTAAVTNGYGLQLESADHGFESGESVVVAGTTNFNGSYVVNYRSLTQVEFPIGASHASESTGTATLARMDVRTERGITKVVQGQTIDIGEQDSKNIQQYVGMSSLAETSPVYLLPPSFDAVQNNPNYNTGPSDSLTLRTAEVTAMVANKAQDKTVKYLTGATSAVNTTNGAAQELTFFPASSTLTILQPSSPGNAVVTLPSVTPGISLNTNQSAYVVISRNASSTPSIVVANTTSVPLGEDVFVIASRLGTNTVYLWDGTEVIDTAPLIPTYPALIRVKYFDPISQTLPTGNPVVEDGSNLQAGDLVLFANLLSGNNQIYMALGTGTNITGWQLQYLWNGSATPSSADTVIIEEGTSFQDQIGKFNDTTWVFNDKVRYFGITLGGSASYNYFEQDALAVTTLTDNTSNGTVFSVNYAGSEYMIIDFSLNRSTSRETGSLYVTTDGTNVSVAEGGSYLGSTGILFSGSISGPNFILQYTSTATGSSATMKFMVRRWSNQSGGPAGIPSYTGAASSIAAAGPNESIQFNNSGLLDGNANFLIDVADGAVILGGLQQSILSSGITLTDNTASPTTMFTYNAASFPFAVIEFSILRNGAYEVGQILLANDTIATAQSYSFVNTATTGITISSAIIGPNVAVQYTSTATGFNGTFKYEVRRWS